MSKRMKIVAIILLVLLFFAFSPCFLPPNYHSLSERKRLIVETAAKSAFQTTIVYLRGRGLLWRPLLRALFDT
ncbi:MAG: hypothetical protein B6U76_02295 [Desulfurococcales archaeon ex4484_217_2]|nr:MAG: hypothetical protein B6U76_02295 [Desulfurococcales archaeon ex4484_217_2]